MKFLNKIFSTVLSSLMLISGMPNTYANPKTQINALVMGDRNSKLKFIKNVFKPECFDRYLNEEHNTMTHFVGNAETEIGVFKFNINKLDVSFSDEFLSETINKEFEKEITSGFYPIILATVDLDQALEKIHSDMMFLAHYIADWKDNRIQVIIIGCSEDIQNKDFRFLNRLTNYTGNIVEHSGEEGWGKAKRMDLDNQFLGFGNTKDFDSFYDTIYHYYKNYLTILASEKKKLHYCMIV